VRDLPEAHLAWNGLQVGEENLAIFFPRDLLGRGEEAAGEARWRACEEALHDQGLRARVEANTAALSDLGHWGVPVLVFDGELFWGQDRIEDLQVALGDAGLERSPNASERGARL